MGIRNNLNYAQKICLGRCGKLMQQTGMLRPGARVGIAVSGGVDSWVLARVMMIRQKIVPFAFEIILLHVNPGFDPGNHEPLVDWLQVNPLPGHIQSTNIGPMAHHPQNTKSPCFLCSWNRRKILFDLCRKYNITHLALGHNAEDLAATFFMNLIQTSRVDGLSAREEFFQGRLTLIRPMLLVEKKYIRNAARRWELPVWENPCPSAGASKRTEMEKKLDVLSGGDKKKRQNILNAFKRWQLDLACNLT